MVIQPRIYKIEDRCFVKFEFKECDVENIQIIIKCKRKEIFNQCISTSMDKKYPINGTFGLEDILWFFYQKDDDLIYIKKLSIVQSDYYLDTGRISRSLLLESKNKLRGKLGELSDESLH